MIKLKYQYKIQLLGSNPLIGIETNRANRIKFITIKIQFNSNYIRRNYNEIRSIRVNGV